MLSRRVLALSAAVVFGLAVGVTAWLRSASVDLDDLARRCAEAAPQWQRYQEDIKALGAGPVAMWHGRPVRAEVNSAGVEVVFELEPPWDRYDAALPILLRTPDGAVYQYSASGAEGRCRTYHYDRGADQTDASLPWIEVHYPHTERRLVLDPAGRWEAAPEN